MKVSISVCQSVSFQLSAVSKKQQDLPLKTEN